MIEKLQDADKLKRKNVLRFKVNDLELEALEKYCKKYRIKNKSQFIRETIFSIIIKKFEDDYPTLFDVSDL